MNIEEIKARAEAVSVQFRIEAKPLLNGIFIEPFSCENIEFLTYAAHDVLDLIAEVERLQKQLDAAVEDLEWLASTTVDSLRCNICKYNPNDMGCELDGSQFDDDGECHFKYWRRGERSE